MSGTAGGITAETPPKLSTLDRYLAVWILIAMAAGLLLGRGIPGLDVALDALQIDGISVPIALGLLVMMYPVLAKVRYDRLDTVTGDRRLMASSLVMNWLVGPALMFAVLGWFYLDVLPGWLGLAQTTIAVSPWQIAKSVLIFLGIPLLAGFLTRHYGERAKGREWYEETFLPRIGPWALYGLLFTIVLLFAMQGEAITSKPLDVARLAVPLLLYFVLMWGIAFGVGAAIGLGYPRTVAMSMTAAGNNFELAIAVAIGTYGVASGQALAGVVGPLIEVPILVGLAYLSLTLRGRFRDRPGVQGQAAVPAHE